MDHDDDASDAESDTILARIAHILGVPTASFFAPEPCLPSGSVDVVASDGGEVQALAVMRLYLRLKDPEARARCVSFITNELLSEK